VISAVHPERLPAMSVSESLRSRSIPCKEAVLEIVAVEHDATSSKVPRIPKLTAGRALE
jgi:hypothetical protein